MPATSSSLVETQGWRKLFFRRLREASTCSGHCCRRSPHRPGSTAGNAGASAAFTIPTPRCCRISCPRKPPFAVVSTGTWVISMAVGARPTTLDPARDTLVNVNAFGDPVPSARFMGGREFEHLMAGENPEWSDADIDAVLSRKIMLLPSIQRGSGPFPDGHRGWVGA